MRYTVTKLDKRYSNHDLFGYMIEFGRYNSTPFSSGVLEFHRALQWFNRTWGFTVTVDIQQTVLKQRLREALRTPAEPSNQNPLNPHWAYSSKYREFRIYVRGEEELALFQLVHAGG